VSVLGAESIFKVAPHYLSYTIDLSDERGFFMRDLTNKKLRWMAKQLAPAVLRVGGSGGDELYYDVPHNESHACPGPSFGKCKKSKTVASRGPVGEQCLNTSQWDALNGFAQEASAHLVFGLNFFLRPSDPQVEALLAYSVNRNYSFWGLEYGNEQIKGAQTECLEKQVEEGLAIFEMAERLWPDPQNRPRLIGPDAGGFSKVR
jgi:hypothetical protein